MPRHPRDTNSYSMIVVTNKRADGRFQYKVTLPKALGDSAMAIKDTIEGEFMLSEVGYGREEPTLVFRMDRYRNPSEKTQEQFMNAKWTDLVCPFCKKPADPPLFPEGAEPISHIATHGCGAPYYADRSDQRTLREWNEIKGTGKDWIVVHNYHILYGRVASDLPPDFDVIEGDSRMTHVVFLSPASGDPNDSRIWSILFDNEEA